jgi:hypothetical protein
MKSGVLSNKTNLPTWAVTLMAMVVFIYLGVFIGGVRIAFVAKNILEQAIDPKKVKQVAHDIAKFAEPLPTGYQYGLGLDLGALKMLTIEHNPDKQRILLLSQTDGEDADSGTGQAVLKRIYDGGINIPTTGSAISAHFLSQKAHGEVQIAHDKMCYIVGDLVDTENKRLEGLVGCILLRTAKKTNRTISVYSIQPDGQPYNLDETLRLLNSISGFDD